MRRMGVACLAPDINASIADFTVEETKDGFAVRYALAALKSVGEGAMERLVAERDGEGPYKGIDDFAHRVDPRALTKRQLETLAAAGAFGSFDLHRAGVFACAETILAGAARVFALLVCGLYGLIGGEDAKE